MSQCEAETLADENIPGARVTGENASGREAVVPWANLVALIEPYYPKTRSADRRPPAGSDACSGAIPPAGNRPCAVRERGGIDPSSPRNRPAYRSDRDETSSSLVVSQPEITRLCGSTLTAKEPEDERDDRGDDHAGRNGKVEHAVRRFDTNVTGQATEAEPRQPWPEKPGEKQYCADGN